MSTDTVTLPACRSATTSIGATASGMRSVPVRQPEPTSDCAWAAKRTAGSTASFRDRTGTPRCRVRGQAAGRRTEQRANRATTSARPLSYDRRVPAATCRARRPMTRPYRRSPRRPSGVLEIADELAQDPCLVRVGAPRNSSADRFRQHLGPRHVVERHLLELALVDLGRVLTRDGRDLVGDGDDRVVAVLASDVEVVLELLGRSWLGPVLTSTRAVHVLAPREPDESVGVSRRGRRPK